MLRIYCLALKYWLLQGDEWKFAVEYATSLVKGFKKPRRGHDDAGFPEKSSHEPDPWVDKEHSHNEHMDF